MELTSTAAQTREINVCLKSLSAILVKRTVTVSLSVQSPEHLLMSR
jgi:hypothetical protein